MELIQIQFTSFTDVVDVWSRICMQRQNSLRDAPILEQSMQIVLSHAHDVLNKRTKCDPYFELYISYV